MQIISACTPESVGLSSTDLAALIRELDKYDNLHSIIILRHGQECLSGWWKPFSAERPHMLFSLSKSFTSIAIGLAQSEKRLSIDDKLLSFFPEYLPCLKDPRMGRVTLRHLLTMTSGHRDCARCFCLGDPDGNWVRGFLSSPLDYEPGTHFAYNSAATFMLSAVLRKVTGQNCRDYLMPRLFTPLDIIPGPWDCSPDGTNVGGWGLYLKTGDLAKVGQVLLQHGVWDGEQLLPADYLAEATSPQSDNSSNNLPDWKCGYGFQFWKSQHGFRGDGASGQYIIVLPEQDMVIATTAGLGDMQRMLTTFWELLLPKVQDAPLPENPVELGKLRQLVANLEITIAPSTISDFPHEVFSLELPSAIASFVEVDCRSDSECRLTFTTKRGPEKLRAGYGKLITGQTLWLEDEMPRRVGACAVWRSKNQLEIQTYCYDASFRDVITITLENGKPTLTSTGSCNTFRPLFLLN